VAVVQIGMKDYALVRERYLQDSVPVRLGGLAANLRRIQSFTSHAGNREVVESVLDESKFFIEWTAPDADVDAAAELVELQVQLSRWQRDWPGIWVDTTRRQQVAEQSGVWSDRVLALSGLLKS
jgi:hypothetical protein